MSHGILLVGGYRTHQENYAPLFRDHPRCRLVAVTDGPGAPDRRRELTRRFAGDLGLPYIHHYEEALARTDVTVVSSCPDIEARGEANVAAARAGKHLYLDKPLAGSIADSRAIAAAVGESGVAAQMYSYVTSPWAREARAAVAENRIGTLRAVHVEVVFAKGFAGTIGDAAARREPGVPTAFTFPEAKRELFDLGVYALSLALWIAGRRALSVVGHTANYFFAEHLSLDTDDFGCLMVELQGGVTATVVGGRFGWHSHPQDGLKRAALSGTAGALTFDAYTRRIEVYNADPALSTSHPNPEDPMGMWVSTSRGAGVLARRHWQATPDDVFRSDVHAFIEAVEGSRKPEMGAELAAHVTETLLAGYLSAATGRAERVGDERD